jgi:ketosteroid isomerase-like protein
MIRSGYFTDGRGHGKKGAGDSATPSRIVLTWAGFVYRCLGVALLLAGLSYGNLQAAVPDDLRLASDSASATVRRALSEEEGSTLASVFTENGAVISPSGEVLRGRMTLKASALLLMMTLGGGDLTLKRHNLNLLDSTGIETGSFTFRKAEAAKDDRGWVGRYTVIWEKENNQWKISRAIGIL